MNALIQKLFYLKIPMAALYLSGLSLAFIPRPQISPQAQPTPVVHAKLEAGFAEQVKDESSLRDQLRWLSETSQAIQKTGDIRLANEQWPKATDVIDRVIRKDVVDGKISADAQQALFVQALEGLVSWGWMLDQSAAAATSKYLSNLARAREAQKNDQSNQ